MTRLGSNATIKPTLTIIRKTATPRPSRVLSRRNRLVLVVVVAVRYGYSTPTAAESVAGFLLLFVCAAGLWIVGRRALPSPDAASTVRSTEVGLVLGLL